MKLRLFSILLLLGTSGTFAQGNAELRTYLDRYFPICPGAKVEIEQVSGKAPRPFVPYRVRYTSTEKYCGKETYALVSPATKQVLIADVFPLPQDMRRLEVRLAELGERQLKKPVRVTVAQETLDDGLREVNITVDGKEGPFDFRGYVDASDSYLIVGRRGKLTADPRKEFLSVLNTYSPAKRGKKDATINIVEVSDLQCPTCKHAHDLLNPLIEKNLGRISYSRIDLPLFDNHDWSLNAALAARALQKNSPEHYWEFIDYVFENQAALKSDNIAQFIQDFVESQNVDQKKFDAVYRSPAERKKMVKQVEQLFNAGVFATPTYLVNGREIFYGREGAHLKQHLENLLKK